MNQSAVNAATFTVNPKLDIPLLGKAYQGSRRLHIANFLLPIDADRLYQHLHTEVAWRTLLVANGRQLGTPPGPEGVLSADEERELIEHAHQGARDGFASLFDTDRLPARDAEEDSDASAGTAALFSEFTNFLNSPLFLDLFRRITGIPELTRVDARATRFRAGHFVMFHDAVVSGDKTDKRRVNYSFNLTPEWRPEWGGMTELRAQQEAPLIEAVQPCFNTLDLIAFPQGHWVSAVAPFARGPRYAISGCLHVD